MTELALPRSETEQSLRRYLDHRISPGGFLTAVLSNDLLEAMQYADRESREELFAIVCWLVRYFPSGCWGSPQRVHAWLHPEWVKP